MPPALICRDCTGIYDMQGGPIPANFEAQFPVWDNPETWNLDAFLPIEPPTVRDAGLTDSEVESLILKYLLSRGDCTGRESAVSSRRRKCRKSRPSQASRRSGSTS